MEKFEKVSKFQINTTLWFYTFYKQGIFLFVFIYIEVSKDTRTTSALRSQTKNQSTFKIVRMQEPLINIKLGSCVGVMMKIRIYLK